MVQDVGFRVLGVRVSRFRAQGSRVEGSLTHPKL